MSNYTAVSIRCADWCVLNRTPKINREKLIEKSRECHNHKPQPNPWHQEEEKKRQKPQIQSPIGPTFILLFTGNQWVTYWIRCILSIPSRMHVRTIGSCYSLACGKKEKYFAFFFIFYSDTYRNVTWYKSNWAATWENQQNDCAPSEDSDHPSLIRVFTVCMKKAWVLSYPLSAQRRLWSDWADADAQAELSLHWAHMSFCWVFNGAAQLMLLWMSLYFINSLSSFVSAVTYSEILRMGILPLGRWEVLGSTTISSTDLTCASSLYEPRQANLCLRAFRHDKF